MYYNNFKLTDEGRKLLSEVRDGNVGLDFRYLAIGAGEYCLEEKEPSHLRNAKNLKDERQRVSFSFIGRKEDGSVNLKASLPNDGLKNGYYMTEAGIFAGIRGSEDEVLYCIAFSDHPDYMPDDSSEKPFQVIFNITVGIGDVDKVSIQYDNDTFALAEDLQGEITRASAAEGELDDKISAETTRATAAEEELDDKISAETTRATAAEGGLYDKISAETTRATAAEGELDDKISAETTRATAAEGGLYDKISAETVRAIAAEKTIKTELENTKLDKNGDASEVTTNFTQADTRANISTGEKLSVILGKIKKFFADLKTVAFSGSYNDLIDQPTSMKNPNALTIKLNGTSQGAYDGSAEKTVNVTPAGIGLGNVNNTSDLSKPVSTAQQAALDAYYQQSTGYTDSKIAGLINGAPSTLDTLGEIANAMADNADVVAALNESIGKKASAAEFDSHAKDQTVHITAAERQNWNDPTVSFTQADSRTNIGTGEKLSVILGKIKKFFSDLKTVAFSGNYNDLTNKPTALKNPNSLTIKLNGESQGAYDGSAEKTVNVTPAGIGALPIAGGTITGDLRLKGSGNYGNKINFGDAEYVFLHEYEDDKLLIKAKTIKLTASESIEVNKPINCDITGNSATSDKWKTARTIEITGDVVGSVSVDGSANAVAQVTRRGCVVGQYSDTAPNPFYLFATTKITNPYDDRSITFHVTRGHGDYSTEVGILTAHVRTNGSTEFEYGEMVWEYAVEGIDTSKFRFDYIQNTAPFVLFRLWVKIDVPYKHVHFDVISESTRAQQGTYLWDLRNKSSVGGVSDTLYGSQASTLAVLSNPIRPITQLGNGTDGFFVNVVKLSVNDGIEQIFHIPTNGKTFIALQFMVGEIVLPNDHIESIIWRTNGVVKVTRKVAGEYANWDFYVFYLLI